jgi:hypothetical protein
MSEPDGTFRSENILSNETGFQMVIPGLLKAPRAGKVYMGVGPEQNFTYIAAIKPKMAIIVDIRRGNRCEHLLYKALFELSKDRAEFISRLFSKPRPAGLDTTTSADSIMNAFWNVNTDTAMYTKNRAEVRDVLLKKHSLPLDAADLNGIDYVYEQFLYGGPSITYNFSTNGYINGGGRGGNSMPTYYDIMTATDGTGLNRSYVANEANWRWLKDLEGRNMLVPIVGNFGGPKAIREVAKWLKERNAVVTAFYASNVEQYLFQDGIAFNYYDSVAELPTDSTSVFIRSNGGGGRGGGFGGPGGMRGPNYMCPIQQLLSVYKAGRIGYYGDIFNYCQ